MTKEERTRLSQELAEYTQEHKAEFNAWYETGNFAAIESYCRFGWMLDRLMDEVDRA